MKPLDKSVFSFLPANTIPRDFALYPDASNMGMIMNRNETGTLLAVVLSENDAGEAQGGFTEEMKK